MSESIYDKTPEQVAEAARLSHARALLMTPEERAERMMDADGPEDILAERQRRGENNLPNPPEAA